MDVGVHTDIVQEKTQERLGGSGYMEGNQRQKLCKGQRLWFYLLFFSSQTTKTFMSRMFSGMTAESEAPSLVNERGIRADF